MFARNLPCLRNLDSGRVGYGQLFERWKPDNYRNKIRLYKTTKSSYQLNSESVKRVWSVDLLICLMQLPGMSGSGFIAARIDQRKWGAEALQVATSSSSWLLRPNFIWLMGNFQHQVKQLYCTWTCCTKSYILGYPC